MVWRLACVMLLTACGPAIGDDVNDDDVGSSSSSPETSSSSGGSSSSESGSGEVSTGTPLTCDAFHDEAREGTPMTVSIVNDGDEPLILDAPCFNTDYLRLESASGWYWPSGFCAFTCESQFVDGCFQCDGCATAAYTVVMPGGSLEVSWPGVLFESVMPPTECFAMGECGTGCPRRRIDFADLVTATVSAISYDACAAGNLDDPSVCACDESKGLTCETDAFESIASDRSAMAIYEPGMMGPITITFGP